MPFTRSTVDVACALIGATLTFNGSGGIITETEAYLPDDPASHSFNGPTPRNRPMFGPAGRVYVYLSYGMHWCLNIVTETEGTGAAVLIRALEPTIGIDAMVRRRGTDNLRNLCSGPGKLCQALGIDASTNNYPVGADPFSLDWPATEQSLVTGPRIGISKAMDKPWRFGLAGSRFWSRGGWSA